MFDNVSRQRPVVRHRHVAEASRRRAPRRRRKKKRTSAIYGITVHVRTIYIGRAYIGRNHICHDHVGHQYTSHTYTDRNYTCHDCMSRARMSMERCVSSARRLGGGSSTPYIVMAHVVMALRICGPRSMITALQGVPPQVQAIQGHNYIGHDYMGHNYIGHNYMALQGVPPQVQAQRAGRRGPRVSRGARGLVRWAAGAGRVGIADGMSTARVQACRYSK